MSTRTRLRQLAHAEATSADLLSEVEVAYRDREAWRRRALRAEREADDLHRQLAGARDGDGVLIVAHDEEEG